MTIFTVILCVDTAGFFGFKVVDHSICIVFKIQIAVVLQENAGARELVFCQLKFHMAQTQVAGVGDQVSTTSANGICMGTNRQLEILERDITGC